MRLPTLLAFLMLAGTARAQASADSASVLAAVARYASSAIARDPRQPAPPRVAFDTTRSSASARSGEGLAAILRTLGATPVDPGAVVVCERIGGPCTFSGYSALVGIRVDSLSGEAARVELTLETPTGLPRVPIYIRGWMLALRKDADGWRVERVLDFRRS